MDIFQSATSVIGDPIIDLIEDLGESALSDDFIIHQITLSDVVKNDMRRELEWDIDTVHSKLWSIVKSGLDKNGRYRKRPLEIDAERYKKYSSLYIDSQCLLTEWLCIYRAIRVYCRMLKKRRQPD